MADSPLTPTMQAQLEQLLGLQTDRAARTSPIHQAAMAMAARMAPGYAQSAMTAPSSLPKPTGSLMPSVSAGGGPGAGSITAAALAAALLKPGSPLLALLKKFAGLPGGAADPTFGGLIQGNKPFAGGTGFPDVPMAGGSASGGMGPIPGYFQNPDGSQVGIGGDPANGGGYGGGLFPSQPEDPRHD